MIIYSDSNMTEKHDSYMKKSKIDSNITEGRAYVRFNNLSKI